MKYLILILALTLGAVAHAQTAAVEGKVAELNAKTGVVLLAWIERAPNTNGGQLPGALYSSRVAWIEIVNGLASFKGQDLIVKVTEDAQGQVLTQTAYWLGGSLPGPLQPAPADAYITGRTSPFTKTQVEAFCNTQWKATSGNSAARDIIEFTVSNVTANTVRVSGLFHDVATGNRVTLTYLISLVDANGATTGANVKFEKVIE